jgi:hypothetical protein
MTIASRIRRVMIVLALALPTAQPAISQTTTFWSHETVDNPGDSSVGMFSSTVVDSAGRAQIAYFSFHHGSLLFAKKTASGSWLKETIDGPGYPINAGGNVALALDGNGQAHVTYYYAANLNNSSADLRYAKRVCSNPSQDLGCQWFTQTVEAGVFATGAMGSTSLAIDGYGRPNIVYFDNWRSRLKWARWEGSSWGITDVVAAVSGRASMVLDSNGLPRIAFTDYAVYPPPLKYAKVTCYAILCGWTIENVGIGMIGNLALDAAGAVHLAYRGQSFSVKYGLKSCASCAWTSTVIGSMDNQDGRPGLALNSGGAPRIIFGDFDGSLNYSRLQSGIWSNQVLAHNVVAYSDMSVMFDVYNRAHVTYQSSENPYWFSLKHATEYTLTNIPRK